MKTTKGVVRRLDGLGRIVLPREYRKTLNIVPGVPLEMSILDNGDILVHKVDVEMELSGVIGMALDKMTVGNNLIMSAYTTNNRVAISSNVGNSLVFPLETPSKLRAILEKNKPMACSGEDVGMPQYLYAFVAPISGDIDSFGGIVSISNSPISEANENLIKVVGQIIGQSVQKY